MPYREALQTMVRRCEKLRLQVADLERALHLPPRDPVDSPPVSTQVALEAERALWLRLEELERFQADARARARADDEDGLAAHVTGSVELLEDTVSTRLPSHGVGARANTFWIVAMVLAFSAGGLAFAALVYTFTP